MFGRFLVARQPLNIDIAHNKYGRFLSDTNTDLAPDGRGKVCGFAARSMKCACEYNNLTRQRAIRVAIALDR